MTLTITQARVVLADHLDDASNIRWSTTQLDTALGYALSSCLTDYVAAGGDRFDEEVSATSTTAGVVDLSSYDPIAIKSVSMLIGSRYWPIPEGRVEQRIMHDTDARTLQIRLVRNLSLSTTAGDKLLSYGEAGARTAVPSWDAFEHWLILRAALFASAKDAEARPEIARLEERAAASVAAMPRTPKAMPFPRRRGLYSQLFGFVWQHGAQDMQITKRLGF